MWTFNTYRFCQVVYKSKKTGCSLSSYCFLHLQCLLASPMSVGVSGWLFCMKKISFILNLVLHFCWWSSSSSVTRRCAPFITVTIFILYISPLLCNINRHSASVPLHKRIILYLVFLYLYGFNSAVCFQRYDQHWLQCDKKTVLTDTMFCNVFCQALHYFFRFYFLRECFCQVLQPSSSVNIFNNVNCTQSCN